MSQIHGPEGPRRKGGIASWAIRRPIGTVMLTAVILVLGTVFVGQLPLDLLPRIVYPQVRVGVSPRGVIALTRAAQAYALIQGRGWIMPEDLKELSGPVFAHRVLLSPDAQVRGVTAAEVLAQAVASVAVPLPAGQQPARS